MDRQSLRFAFDHLKGRDNLSVAEIGVAYGVNADDIYTALNPKEMYLIDCYEIQPCGFEEFFTLEEHKSRYLSTLEKFSGREGIHFIKKRSQEAALHIKDRSLDYIYIDASHDEINVLIDIACWYPKLKIGGVLGGHDIDYPSVKKIVSLMFGDFQMNGRDWWVVKKAEGYA